MVSATILWVAAGCQQSVAPRLAVGGISPDFLLVALGCLAICGSRRSGSLVGFFSGLLQGGLAGANLAQYVVSRTIVGYFVGWFTSLEFEANPVVAFFSVAITTLGSQLLLMFMAPPSKIIAFLLATIGLAMYNGVLAMPLFALLKRVIEPPVR